MTIEKDNVVSDRLCPPAASHNSARSQDEDDRGRNIASRNSTSPFTRKFLARILRDFCRKFLRGYAGGVILYAGVRILSALLRKPSMKKIAGIISNIVSKDCTRLAAFCGLYPGLYHLLVEVVAALQKRKNGWTYGISGGLAGLSIAVLDNSRRKTVTFLTLSRALGAGFSTLVSRGHISALPFADLALFSAFSGIVMYCMILGPQYMNQGYYKSILQWSRDYTDERAQLVFRHPGPSFVTCQEGGIHQGPCGRHAVVDFLWSLPVFARLYLPIYVAPVVAFKRKLIMEKPLQVLRTLARNTALSALFLGSLVSLCKVILCLRNVSPRPPPLPAYIAATSGLVAGLLSLLIERKSRRHELNLFVIPQILTILYNMARSSKLSSHLRLPHGFTLTFALAMMSVMHAYEREPQSLTPLAKGVLKVFVGPTASDHLDVL